MRRRHGALLRPRATGSGQALSNSCGRSATRGASSGAMRAGGEGEMDSEPPFDALIAYRWDVAEIKRMQRTEDQRNALLRSLARCRVRCLIARIITRLAS